MLVLVLFPRCAWTSLTSPAAAVSTCPVHAQHNVLPPHSHPSSWKKITIIKEGKTLHGVSSTHTITISIIIGWGNTLWKNEQRYRLNTVKLKADIYYYFDNSSFFITDFPRVAFFLMQALLRMVLMNGCFPNSMKEGSSTKLSSPFMWWETEIQYLPLASLKGLRDTIFQIIQTVWYENTQHRRKHW